VIGFAGVDAVVTVAVCGAWYRGRVASGDWTTNAEAAVDAACRRAPNPNRMLCEVLDEIERLLALRGAALYHHTAEGQLVFLHGSLLPHLVEVDPVLLHPDNDPCHRIVGRLTPRPRVVHASGDVPRDVLRRSPSYRHFYRPHGIDHVVCMWLDGRRPPEPGMTGMFLSRGDDEGGFASHHLELLRNALPLLTAAVLRTGDPSPHARWVVLGPRGDVQCISPPAELCLRAIGLRPDELSDRLWGPIQRWRSLRTAHPFAGEPSAVFHLVERRRGAVYVEVTEHGGELRLRVLDRQHVPRLAALRERHGLTASELAVLQALALGLSNTEASEYLCVSTETVKTHVRRALAKLGLGSRLQAGLLMQRIVMNTF
jgi:DNA-binding CsgD family transcriptional regulator